MDVFARAWAITKADSEEMKRITSTPSTGQDEDAAKRTKESEAAKIAEIQERNKKNRENLNKSNFLTGNRDEVACGCGFIYDQFKDFHPDDLNYCLNCGERFHLPEMDGFR